MALADIFQAIPESGDHGPAVRRNMQIASVSGLLPFMMLTLAIAFLGADSGLTLPLADTYKIYAAFVLSFLGGIHWGLILAGRSENDSAYPERTVLATLLAPLVGWISIFISGPMGFAFLIVAYAGQGAWDNFAAHNGRLPTWFAGSRMLLTAIASALMAVTMYTIA